MSALAIIVALVVAPMVPAQNAPITVSVGTFPEAIAINTVTNKIYVANSQDNSVTVIDGVTNATATVPVGLGPLAIAVNSVTNKVYVANVGYDNDGPTGPGSVTVIDGTTNATTTVPVGTDARAIAVNMVTNMIYVAYFGATGPAVMMIDGATNTTASVSLGAGSGLNPEDVAVNPVTNKIYVANQVPIFTNSVTVIDGVTSSITNVPIGIFAGHLAVNSVTNKVYVTNIASNSVSVIDGVTNSTVTVATGTNPNAVAVNPVTNRIYTANNGSNDVTVIDGATNATTTVPVGEGPDAVAVNPVTNTIYVADGAGYLTVIDGATNATTAVSVGFAPDAVAANPVANVVYVVSAFDDDVSVIAGSAPVQIGSGSSARLVNISTRAQVGTGQNVLIPGFVIGGIGTEALLIRGDGPSLAQFGVTGLLAQPVLSVFDSAGTMIATNTGWGTSTSPAQIASVSAQVGAYALAAGSADSALLVNLPPGAYTVQVSGVGNTSGVALAEIYEVSSTGTFLVNISTRAQVGTGGNIIIPGFVISGSGTEELLVRADGPSLSQFGVTGILAQPSLTLFNSAGTAVASNTGWTSAGPDLIAAFGKTVGAFLLASGSLDSAQIVNLPAGAYTMQVSGVSDTTGVALAEIYVIP